MKYIRLNPIYTLRNESNCSFIIRRNLYIDSDLNGYNPIHALPPFIGYILSNIGRCEFKVSIKSIADHLQISADILYRFLKQIISQPIKRLCFNNHEHFFPANLLIYDKEGDYSTYYTVNNFSPFNPFKVNRPTSPLIANFMITEQCNTNCIYCYAKRDMRKEMTTKDIIKCIKDLHQNGVINLTLTGGDIFARKDWHKILLTSRTYKFNSLISTKTPLSEDDICFLKEIGITQIQLSMDSVVPSTLKNILKADINYIQKLENMIRKASEYNLKIHLRTVLCQQNTNTREMQLLMEIINKYNSIHSWTLTPAFLSEHKSDYNAYSVNSNELSEVYNYIKEFPLKLKPIFNKVDQNGYKLQRTKTVEEFVENNQNCYANVYSMSILPTGDCTICEMLYYNKQFLIGNILRDNLNNIWNSPKALDLYQPTQKDSDKTSVCISCTFFKECRTKITKKICYVDIMKVSNNKDYPDPKCPKASSCHYIL